MKVLTAEKDWQRLFLLRNLTILVVVAASLLIAIPFEFPIDVMPASIVVVAIIVINLFAWMRLRQVDAIGIREIFLQLFVDVIGMSVFFFFTGAASNPFVWFLLLPLLFAATLLPRREIWIIAIQTIIAYTALLVYGSVPAGEHAGHSGMFQMHVVGMWIGFLFCAGFVSTLLVSMAENLRQQREQALRNDKLVALGTLAAGAAHELGTPLGTISLLADELRSDTDDFDQQEIREKAEIISSQIDRCKEALSVMSFSAGEERMESGSKVAVGQYIKDTLAEWQQLRPGSHLSQSIDTGCGQFEIIAERTLTQALVNLLSNAADAAHSQITVRAHCEDHHFKLDIMDDGAGFEQHMFSEIGKAPIKSRKGKDGLGVGLFLAYASIQRLGGSISVGQRAEGGTVISVLLPLYNSEMI